MSVKKLSKGEELLALHIRAAKLPPPVREFVFCPGRKFRADFAFIPQKLLIEVEGGTWSNGRHNRGGGFGSDCLKYNLAAMLGYRLLRFTTEMVEVGLAIETIERALNG